MGTIHRAQAFGHALLTEYAIFGGHLGTLMRSPPVGISATWPFWAGMPTEDQTPTSELRDAIKQASWISIFETTLFVSLDPDLCRYTRRAAVVSGISTETPSGTKPRRLPEEPFINDDGGVLMSVRVIRTQTHQSWSNICKATQALQGNDHDPFGTSNVEASSKSCVRRILRETGLTIRQLETLLFDNRFC